MAPKKKQEPVSDWDVILKGIDKKFGSGILFNLAQTSGGLDVDTVSSLLVGLDDCMGIFGWPLGRVVEIFGGESSGKTTLALSAVRAFQVAFSENPVVFIDMEHALDIPWMLRCGVSKENLYISQPGSAEEATQLAVTLANTGKPRLIVIDSIAALVPQAERDGEMTGQQVGMVGRIMGKFMRKIVPILQQHNIMLLCTNQTRSQIGMPGTVRPGGRALKFHASMVMKLARTGRIDRGDQTIGNTHSVTIQKNKVAPPYKSAILPLLFETIPPFRCGFCPELSMIETGVHVGFIQKKGAWFSIDEENIGQGSIKAGQYLGENPDLYNTLYANYREAKQAELAMIEYKTPESESEEPPEPEPEESPDV